MDPLGDPLTTHPIQTGWVFTMEPYPSGRCRFINALDRQCGHGSVWTWTRTQSDGPDLLLTLVVIGWRQYKTTGEMLREKVIDWQFA